MVTFETCKCVLLIYIFGRNQVSRPYQAWSKYRATVTGRKQFLWLYPPPANVDSQQKGCFLLLVTTGSPQGVWPVCSGKQHSWLQWGIFLSLPSVPVLALTSFGDVLIKTSGLHETSYRWPFMAAATALM